MIIPKAPRAYHSPLALNANAKMARMLNALMSNIQASIPQDTQVRERECTWISTTRRNLTRKSQLRFK